MEAFFFVYLIGLFYALSAFVVLNILKYFYNKLSGGDIWKINSERMNFFIDPFNGHIVNFKPDKSRFVSALLLNSCLSWIGFLFLLHESFLFIKDVFGSLFVQTQQLKELYYSIRTNPNLQVEVIWARWFAGSIILSGLQPTTEQIEVDLRIFKELIPGFNSEKAIEHLRNLNMVNVLKSL